MVNQAQDWGEASVFFDGIREFCGNRDLLLASEAETRFKVIDRVIREVLGWGYGQVTVEEKTVQQEGYVDYILRDGDYVIVIEAKRYGISFPTVTARKTLKLNGTVLGSGEVKNAIDQVHDYALEKKADVAVVTNGRCWIFYSVQHKAQDSEAHLLFPFEKTGHAEELHSYFAQARVSVGSLRLVLNTAPNIENRLLSLLRNADHRVDRNSIANAVSPAINAAILADALFDDPTGLEKCYVTTEARIKWDSQLKMYLADPKPFSVERAKRIKVGKKDNEFAKIVSEAVSGSAPPVTLLIGSVGSGKSTFLKYFELVSGKRVLAERRIHWIYVDFEKMGGNGNPRCFLYQELLDYIEADHSDNPITYDGVIAPAYQDKLNALRRTRLGLIDPQSQEFKDAAIREIDKDYDKVEPYVDRILKYISQRKVCVVVLDNVDLYEDSSLERNVFAEGLALSKRIFCNVIVSIRDSTFVKHQTDATFDAYQLQKLWLNAPEFKEVVSNRLSYSKWILKDRPADICLSNGMNLFVPDLSVFFDIVQKSVLNKESGEFVEAIADSNIRKGLMYINNFLTSGHINADIAIKNYLQEDKQYTFPFHEVFKGAMLSQWKYFQEAKSPYCVNLFDARLGSRTLQLLRFHLLKYLTTRAQADKTLEVNVQECVDTFSPFGVSETRVIDCLGFFQKQGLIRTTSAETIGSDSTVTATRTAGYYVYVLAHKFVYVESVMYDTAINDQESWEKIRELTLTIESQQANVYERMLNRRARIELFLNYLSKLEDEYITSTSIFAFLRTMGQLATNVLAEGDDAVKRSKSIIMRML